MLVVAKLDRLSRSIADFASLLRQAEQQGWAAEVPFGFEHPGGDPPFSSIRLSSW